GARQMTESVPPKSAPEARFASWMRLSGVGALAACAVAVKARSASAPSCTLPSWIFISVPPLLLAADGQCASIAGGRAAGMRIPAGRNEKGAAGGSPFEVQALTAV